MYELARELGGIGTILLIATESSYNKNVDVEVGIKEAKNNLSRLVAAAQKGRRVYLVNRGKRVAEVVPVSSTTHGKRGRGMFKDEIRIPAGWGSQKQREQWEKDFLEELEGS